MLNLNMITDADNFLYKDSSAPQEIYSYFDRPRIRILLTAAVKKPLTTVVAGAGYGKTQAVYCILGNPERNTVWLQLSAVDNHVYRFWERFAYGFKKHNQNLSKSLKASGFPETIAAFDNVLRLLAESLDPKKSTVLVLDDFHLLTDAATLRFIENLILARIQNFSVVLISRKKPGLNLAGLLSKGLLVRITEDDLRFTREEMSDYYENMGLQLDEKTNAEIYNYTEGWIFAVYLIGLSLKKGQGGRINPSSLAKDDLYELIEKDVFAYASQKLKKFLVRIAALEFLPKELFEEFAGKEAGPGDVITEMLELSQFIRYDPFSEAYRMHHLLREFLAEQKGILADGEAERTHLEAAEWYERNSYKQEALEHYRYISRYDKIFDIILSFERQIPQATAESLIKLIDEAPSELLEAKPIMPIAKAYYLMNNNLLDEAYVLLTELRQKHEKNGTHEGSRALLGEIYILLAIISNVRQGYEFEELFCKADDFLPGGSILIGPDFNIAEGVNITGIKNPEAGELKKYFDAMFRVMPRAARVMNGCAYGAEYLNAADSFLMTGNIREAEKNAFEAIFRAEQKKQYGIVSMAEFTLIRIYVFRGDYAKAADLLHKMKQRQDGALHSGFIPLYDIIAGWFSVKMGDIGKVSKWIRQEEDKSEKLPPVIVGREYLVRSDSLLAEGRYGELLAFMDYTDDIYAERGILYAIIQNKITKAIIYHYMGNFHASIKALNESWELSNPNNLIIQYIEYGTQMRTLIGAAGKNPDCKIPKSWLDNIYNKSSVYAKQLSGAAADYRKAQGIKKTSAGFAKLSARESEILALLCRGLTRMEIADSCNLSMNTVKTILQSIYSKLGASNNADAVHIAASLGILDK